MVFRCLVGMHAWDGCKCANCGKVRNEGLNAKNIDGATPLIVAAERKQEDLVKNLISANARVDLANFGGQTALHVAAVIGHVGIVKLLIAAGSDVDARCERGQTPLLYAAANGHLAVVEALLGSGAKVNLASNSNATPLLFAAVKGHLEIVRLLLRASADPNLAEERGWTPLQEAALKKHEDVVRELLSHGADIDRENLYGWTALHYAADEGAHSIVKLLLDHGAPVDAGHAVPEWSDSKSAAWKRDAKEKLGKTPLYFAKLHGHTKVVDVLVAHGAKDEVKNYTKDQPPQVVEGEYVVGCEGPKGGIVVSLDDSRKHGIEVLREDIKPNMWSEARAFLSTQGARLPTLDELKVIYEMKDKVGGFVDEFYWSSDEGRYPHLRWALSFRYGNEYELRGLHDSRRCLDSAKCRGVVEF